MVQIVDKSKCCGCEACFNVCPKKCISMENDQEGFLYPVVDHSICVNCGLCEKVCIYNKQEPLRNDKPKCYAVKAFDNNIIENSSSGGVFSLLANYFLSIGGVVYGAALNDDNKSCSHFRIVTIEELPRLRGSKYLQSKIGEMHKQIKEDLSQGRKVLFSGVPCQIYGLKLFLQKDFENLFCIEVICHGVPSPLLWKIYIEFLESKYKAKVEAVNFRSKKSKYKKFGIYKKNNKIKQYMPINRDPYMIMFLNNYSMRPSCYRCQAKKLESLADLVIADFWGISNVLPEMDDDKGTSLVLIKTEKGKNLFEQIKESADYKETNFDESIAFNSSYFNSCKSPIERNTFYKDLNQLDFKYQIKKYGKVSFKSKFKGFIYYLLHIPFLKNKHHNKKYTKSRFCYGLEIIFKKCFNCIKE